MEHKPLIKIQILSIFVLVLQTLFVTPQAYAQSDQDVYLASPSNLALPGVRLDVNLEVPEDHVDRYRLNNAEDVLYPPGTKLKFTAQVGVGPYGDKQNGAPALMPLVFVNPVLPDGSVDFDTTIGFPATYVKYQSDNSTIYSDPFYNAEFNRHYESLETSYDTESKRNSLKSYLSYVGELQAGDPSVTIYQGQKVTLASTGGASDGGPSQGTDAGNTPAEPSGRSDSEVAVSAAGVPLNIKDDRRFNDIHEVSTTENMDQVVIKFTDDNGKVSYNPSAANISPKSRFVPAPGEKPQRNKNTGQEYIPFYRLDSKGNFQLDEDGNPWVYYLPVGKIVYTDPVTGEKVPMTVDKFRNLNFGSTAVEPVSGGMTPAQCSNETFSQLMSSVGEECQFVKLENYQQELTKQLNGESESSSLLVSSGVIAVDNNSKTCSAVSLRNEEQLTDPRAQAQVDEYLANMSTDYEKIVAAMFALPENERREEAYVGEPKPGRNTYSCYRADQQCRYSFDYLAAEELNLAQEISLYSDDPSKTETLKIYGPNKDDKYLVRTIRNGEDFKATILHDNSSWYSNSLFGAGDVQSVISAMKSYNSDYKHKTLAEIQAAYGGTAVRESKSGQVLLLETMMGDGENQVEKAMVGTPEATALMSKINTDKTFYELKGCSLKKSNSAPAAPSTESEAQAVE